MENNYQQLKLRLDNNTIQDFINDWESIIGQIKCKMSFIFWAKKLTDLEMLTARTSLIVRGSSDLNHKIFITKFALKYGFVGQSFLKKRYDNPLIMDGKEIGYPVYYLWCRNNPKFQPPNSIGIYYLFNKGLLVYIGFSRKIRTRIRSHKIEKVKEFDAILWETKKGIHFTKWLQIERELIKYWKPSLNKNYLE
jgi:hypothetical protein